MCASENKHDRSRFSLQCHLAKEEEEEVILMSKVFELANPSTLRNVLTDGGIKSWKKEAKKV